MKMNIIEKLQKEDGNSVLLYKEGSFWVAYEQSAFVLSQYKKLKATKKYIKTVAREVVSVGFPPVSLAFFYSPLGEPAQQTDTFLRFSLETPLEAGGFEAWKKELPLQSKSVPESGIAVPAGNRNEIERLIIQYPLAERSPFDAMRFIQELKNRLNSNI
jgi:hypothetical protein